ncbi:MAG: DNA primase [Bacillota bacterium]
MAGGFSEDIIEEIRAKVDLAELIGEYVHLRKQGNRFVGLCPFHSEKTPSFHVTPENGLFYCFGCGTGGDVFSFVMKQEHLDFPQTVEKLAQRAGVTLQRDLSPGQQKNLDQLQRLRELNREAAYYFYQTLRAEPGKDALAYLGRRQVKQSSLTEFALGYAPPSYNELYDHLVSKGFTLEEMVEAGLLLLRDNGAVMGRFRDRIIFPITDTRGRVVGFGGRLLAQGEPKYLNSQETKVFNKRGLLYGLHLALPEIRKLGRVVLVEGYLDVIALYQAGFKNVVASLGTAFSQEHAVLLKRYTREVVILFDNDEAGIKATERAIDIFRDQGIKVKMAALPEAKDPDDFIKDHGEIALQKEIDRAKTIIPYRLEQLKKRYTLENPSSKIDLLQELFPDLAKLTSQVERHEYIRYLAQELKLSEAAIWDDYRRKQGELRVKQQYVKDKSPEKRNNIKVNVNSFRDPYQKAQEGLVRLILNHPELVLKIENKLNLEIILDETCKGVLTLTGELFRSAGDEPITATDIYHHAPGEAKDLIAKLTAGDSLPVTEQILADVLNGVQLQHWLYLVELKQKSIREAEEAKDFLKVQNILQEIDDLQRKIHSLR